MIIAAGISILPAILGGAKAPAPPPPPPPCDWWARFKRFFGVRVDYCV